MTNTQTDKPMKQANRFEQVCAALSQNPKTWLITGVAGFIGSNLLETLLLLNQKVLYHPMKYFILHLV